MQFIKEKACKDFNNKFKTNVGKEHRTINVGIDLGTNSTKVIYQIVELAGAGEKNAFILILIMTSKTSPHARFLQMS